MKIKSLIFKKVSIFSKEVKTMEKKTEKDMLDIYLHYVESFLADGGKKENLSNFEEYCEEYKKLHNGDHSDLNQQTKKSDLIDAQISIRKAELANLESRKVELNIRKHYNRIGLKSLVNFLSYVITQNGNDAEFTMIIR